MPKLPQENREELLACLAENHGERIAEVARRFIDGEVELPAHPLGGDREVPFVVGHQPVVGPGIPRWEHAHREYRARQDGSSGQD